MRDEDVNLDWLCKLQPTNETLAEIAAEEREHTIKEFGRLLTEDEVVELVKEARRELREKGKLGED